VKDDYFINLTVVKLYKWTTANLEFTNGLYTDVYCENRFDWRKTATYRRTILQISLVV